MRNKDKMTIDEWLDQHGGRKRERDLLEDHNGLYVLMCNGHYGKEKIYLPMEKLIADKK